MPCTRPLLGQRTEYINHHTQEIDTHVRVQGLWTDAKVEVRREEWAKRLQTLDQIIDITPLKIPCGKCLDCQQRSKLHWVLRCTQEATQHQSVLFATLTYEKAPKTLSLRDLQLFHKRLRKLCAKEEVDGVPKRYRHFSCGEYGETHGRPHYHAILFGLNKNDEDAIDKAWGHGYTTIEPAGPGAIAYVAGYVNKKAELQTSDEDGWVNPFIVMSRGGKNGIGIGGHARKWRNSWRDHAVLNGNKIPVPRYYHQEWKDTATEEELQALAMDRKKLIEIHGEQTDSQRLARSLSTAARLSQKRQQRRDKNNRL